MNAKPQVVPIFPSPIMLAPQTLPPELVKDVVARFRATSGEKNAKSDLLSHSEMMDAASDEMFSGVAAHLAPRLTEFGELLFGEQLDWNVKEIWVNILETGGAQALHNHANSFISGVIYLTEYHRASGTLFHKPLGGNDFSFVNQGPETRMGPFNASRWQTPPSGPGDMILFPSYMLHEVPKNPGPQRMTIAFNALPSHLNSWGYKVGFV